MKKILFMLIATVALNTGYVMAADSEFNAPSPSKAVAAQVYKMLDVPNIPNEIRAIRQKLGWPSTEVII